MFKPGDKVRKKDGSKFLNGRKEAEVTKVTGATVVLNEIIGVHESKIEKAEEDKEVTFKQGDKVFYISENDGGIRYGIVRKAGYDRSEGMKKVWFEGGGWMPFDSVKLIKESTTHELGTKSIDNINPDHYKTGGIETIDYLKAKLTKEEFRGYLKGNIVKYISRAELKGGLEDYKKAQWYSNKLIDTEESK